jgi:hypothetical protein
LGRQVLLLNRISVDERFEERITRAGEPWDRSSRAVDNQDGDR